VKGTRPETRRTKYQRKLNTGKKVGEGGRKKREERKRGKRNRIKERGRKRG